MGYLGKPEGVFFCIFTPYLFIIYINFNIIKNKYNNNNNNNNNISSTWV